jgi:hypothetical protein
MVSMPVFILTVSIAILMRFVVSMMWEFLGRMYRANEAKI